MSIMRVSHGIGLDFGQGPARRHAGAARPLRAPEPDLRADAGRRPAGRARRCPPGARFDPAAVRRPDRPDRPRGAPDGPHGQGGDPAADIDPWPAPTPVPVTVGWARRRRSASKPPRLTRIAVPELEAEVAFEVGLLLDQFDLLEAQIEAADRRVAGLLDGELARGLQTIPGVGPSITATLISEIGDLSRFDDVDQLFAYAGVHPAERSSGTKGASPETSWHMSKAGNSHLRAAAYRMALVGIRHNPVIAEHYARKRAAGKSKMNAVGHCSARRPRRSPSPCA